MSWLIRVGLLLVLASSGALATGGPEGVEATGAVAVFGGKSHTCAVMEGGVLRCWGSDRNGQIGADVDEICGGYYPCTKIPVDVIGLESGVSMVTTGYGPSGSVSHTCAVTTEGRALCWGANYTGQVGDGQECGLECPVPVDVPGLASGVSSITGGGKHTCAVVSGAVKCWGWNSNRQLGDGTEVDSHVPVDVVGLDEEIATVTAGWYHTCALTVAGSVKCWGYNGAGQLGDNEACGLRCAPVDVVGLNSGVVAIAAGDFHTCALIDTGGVRCWGANWSRQLGVTGKLEAYVPQDVPGLDAVLVAITGGAEHTCGLTKTWGGYVLGFREPGAAGQRGHRLGSCDPGTS